MKKLIYSLAMVLVGLTSCTSFDDPTTENYGAGPSVDVTITAGTPSDSAFTVVITPAAGSLYYTYAISEGSPANVDSATLYKGGYGNTVIKVADKATTTITIDDAAPNTSYYVYAVAGSDKGIIGNMTVKSITTTDALSPSPKSIAKDADNAAVQLTFSEAIQRGEGAVTAQYYKEWDILNPVDVPAEDLTVQVSGKAVVFAADNIPAGAYLCFSYAEGAFKDAKGNLCRALNSGLDLNKGQFAGAWVHVTNVPFEITDEYVTAPEAGVLIAKVEDFKGEITLPFNVYRNDEDVADGAISVTYTNKKSTSTYKLSAQDWSISENKVNFVLPAEPKGGDAITVSVAEEAIFDVYGNPNEEFTSEIEWYYFVPTKENVLGTFNMGITYKGEASDLGKFTIVEDATAENPTGLLFKDFYLEGAELSGYYDLDNAKMYIGDGQIVGKYTNSKGTTYGLVFYNAENETEDLIPVPFTINADGTLTADVIWGIYAFDENFETPAGWFEVAQTCTLTPAKAAARKAAARGKASKTVKVSARNLKKGFVRK